MTAFREISLVPMNQKLSAEINGTTYNLRVNWNGAGNCWILDVYDTLDNPILRGVPLVTGANLLGQYAYLNIGNGVPLVVTTIGVGHSPDEVPTFANLGIDGHLLYLSP